MQSMTIRLPDKLMDWLTEQARIAKRTKNKHVELLIEQAMQSQIEQDKRRK